MTIGKGCVVITGGSAGIGRACAELFAQNGYDLALLARGEERLEKAAEELSAYGVDARSYPCDVADADAVMATAREIDEAQGPIAVWVNNAMTTVIKRFWEMEPSDIRRVMEVTYLGQVHGMMAALKYMRPRDRGAIVNVGSGLAYRAIPLQSAYCAAKHAAKAASEALRTELIAEGSSVTVSMVHPSGINTPQFDWADTSLPNKPQPTEPIFQPETVAKAVVRAAKEGPRELFVGLPALAVFLGGQGMPQLLDRQLASSGADDQTSKQPRTIDNKTDGYAYEPGEGMFGAHGSYDHKAKDKALIVDGDVARFAAVGIGAVAAGAVGYFLGRGDRKH
ncbi:SDR family oxidoreductase [Parvularcula maris]|uniref:SDR family oxidoreductase n=1 Tax=Parvularcula maris TaxID=2965077 RepID=A0A9X2RHB2_9PROT|nr:SDR family oxidoreductase [Parvularcula maris]MCQ8184694.1 SDR family oxidoreductase [Parvularcula maris]